jgi:hypothetical protein
MKQDAKRKRRKAEQPRKPGNLRKKLDRFAASLPPLDHSAPLIRGDRER